MCVIKTKYLDSLRYCINVCVNTKVYYARTWSPSKSRWLLRWCKGMVSMEIN